MPHASNFVPQPRRLPLPSRTFSICLVRSKNTASEVLLDWIAKTDDPCRSPQALTKGGVLASIVITRPCSEGKATNPSSTQVFGYMDRRNDASAPRATLTV